MAATLGRAAGDVISAPPGVRRTARAGASPLGAAGVAAAIAVALLLFGPSGRDVAAHLYMIHTWRDHGWQLWDNFWYSGRYTQVNYSLLFYPLAVLLRPSTVVVGAAAVAAGCFAALLRRRWPTLALGPALAFALLVPLAVVSGTYPFLLGFAAALATVLALEAGHRYLALAGVLVTGLAHPLALAFLLVALAAIALSASGWWRTPSNLLLAGGCGVIAAAQAVLLRGFSTGGARYAFDPKDAVAIAVFCIVGILLTRGLPDQRQLRALFIGYGVLGAVTFSLASPVGGNVVRLTLLMAVPLLMLPLAARAFRPRVLAVALVAVALLWQALPAVVGWRTAAESRAQNESFWYPVISWLASHPEPGYRVQVVATAGDWEAYYLARRDVPLARGWFRQDDFPANAVLYGPLTAHSYDSWLRRTGVHYVFLPDDPLDYSAVNEAKLLRSGQSGLAQLAKVGGWTVFALPKPTPIATPADRISILSLTSDAVTVRATRPGTYRLRLRYTPYWSVVRGHACATPREPWGTDLRVTRAGIVQLSFDVHLGAFVGAVLGSDSGCDAS